MIYDTADKAIRAMNRQNLKDFGKLKLAKWDEINVIRAVAKAYDDSVRMARQRYYEIAFESFIVALLEVLIPNVDATRMAEETITADWILDMLEEVDPVTLYAFLPETERKKQRLIEALAVATNRNAEIDKALRYWTIQVSQFADNSVYNARLEAFRQAGIRHVVWITQEDNRVCEDCDDLNGQIFPIDNVPPPQHINCRCFVMPVLNR